MTTSLLLPWFPIVLAVGVGGRLLGQKRAFGLGLCCALFWIVLTQASAGTTIFSDSWSVFSLISGAAAIVGMGVWAGQGATPMSVQTPGPDGATAVRGEVEPEAASSTSTEEIGFVIDLFDDWLIEYSDRANPWPAFGEFVRSMLYRSCRATHVRPYRLDAGGEELVPIRETDSLTQPERIPARRGVVGHVVTTGRSYVATDAAHGELVDQLAEDADHNCDWCFVINRGTQRLGVVSVGRLEADRRQSRQFLAVVERLIAQFWRTLDATVRCRSAEETDPVSGLPTRPAFLAATDQAVLDSYEQGEPVALALFCIEGIRNLTDHGLWQVADDLVAEIARTLLGKVRSDDRVGRFDGSRFIVLLRRVDSELAALIVEQLMGRLEHVCHDRSRWGAAMVVRCGLVGSGTGTPDVSTLMEQALEQERVARTYSMRTATDLLNQDRFEPTVP